MVNIMRGRDSSRLQAEVKKRTAHEGVQTPIPQPPENPEPPSVPDSQNVVQASATLHPVSRMRQTNSDTPAETTVSDYIDTGRTPLAALPDMDIQTLAKKYNVSVDPFDRYKAIEALKAAGVESVANE